jgi:hypothetical protein
MIEESCKCTRSVEDVLEKRETPRFIHPDCKIHSIDNDLDKRVDALPEKTKKHLEFLKWNMINKGKWG